MIPICRAKKIDSDEYVEGYLDIQKSWETKCLSCGSLDTESHNENWSEACRCNNCGKDLDFHNDNWDHGYIGDLQYLIRSNGEYTQIDPTTLAIHFPDMLDSQGNKIFASLSEDGKGGDKIIEDGKCEDGFNPVFKPYFRKSSFSIEDLPQTPYGQYELHRYRVIGIQE